MENKVINIDFGNYTEEELNLIEEKAKEYKKKSLDRRVAELENWKSQTESRMRLLENENEELLTKVKNSQDEIKGINTKINTIEFADDGSMEELKKACKSRIKKLLGGDMGSPQYITLYGSCLASLYSKIKEDLGGKNKLGKISIDDIDIAMKLANRYVLNRVHITKHKEKLLKHQKEGMLSPEKSRALDLTIGWLESRGI